MATIQDQYTELMKQGQDASLAVLKTWTRTFQEAFSQLPTSGLKSPEQVIDQVYDFAGYVLNAQRDLAKQLIATSTAAAEKVRNGASHTAGADSQG